LTADVVPAPAPTRREPGRLRTFLTTIRAVITRELRWRMRGRRAFLIATITVVLLGLLVFGIHQALYERAISEARWQFDDGFGGGEVIVAEGISGATSARIGQAIFGGLLGVLTVITLLIAPALTSGVVSSEREKQTLELLITTPVSTLGMLIGKLLGALAYVFLLLIASVPLMAIVFVFGGVDPGAVARAYVAVVAIAIGTGSIGLFFSALIGRTQVATVVSYLVVFLLVVGTGALHSWMYATSVQYDERGNLIGSGEQHAPEALLWLNPLITDIDVMCTAVPDVGGFCDYIALVRDLPERAAEPPRDAFWPRSALAFLVLAVVLTTLSTQLISPSRRFRPRGRDRAPTAPAARLDAAPGAVARD